MNSTRQESEILKILHSLPSLDYPHELLGGRDSKSWPNWFKSDNLYPIYTRISSILEPKRILEIGGLVGYSFISMLHGYNRIEEIVWIDNESYISNSNKLAEENLKYYLERFGRKLKYGFDRDICQILKYMDSPGYFDLIHIDGEHTWSGKVRDLAFSYLLKPKFILVDDYHNIDEVKIAVKFFSGCLKNQHEVIKTYRRGVAFFNFTGTDFWSRIISKGLESCREMEQLPFVW